MPECEPPTTPQRILRKTGSRSNRAAKRSMATTSSCATDLMTSCAEAEAEEGSRGTPPVQSSTFRAETSRSRPSSPTLACQSSSWASSFFKATTRASRPRTAPLQSRAWAPSSSASAQRPSSHVLSSPMSLTVRCPSACLFAWLPSKFKLGSERKPARNFATFVFPGTHRYLCPSRPTCAKSGSTHATRRPRRNKAATLTMPQGPAPTTSQS
mmetsp:Transcript_41607/g.134475  ORF Transcript_41607/g.134475 Transcript_41607/m.134475 type:complete len:212 (+) Transcript_41607:484-1119(+)